MKSQVAIHHTVSFASCHLLFCHGNCHCSSGQPTLVHKQRIFASKMVQSKFELSPNAYIGWTCGSGSHMKKLRQRKIVLLANFTLFHALACKNYSENSMHPLYSLCCLPLKLSPPPLSLSHSSSPPLSLFFTPYLSLSSPSLPLPPLSLPVQ